MTEQNIGGVVLHTSRLFAAAGGVAHGFSTRLGGVSEGVWASLNLGVTRGDRREAVEENYRRFRAAMGGSDGPLVKTNQVHGAAVRPIRPEDLGRGFHDPEPEADGLVTDLPGVTLVIFSADCIPVLLYHPGRRVIAAVHAGWRGTAGQIAAAAAEKMASEYGCSPSGILAAIGPGIGPCCFETHEDVPRAMLDAFGDAARPYIRGLPGGKFRVDLKGLNALALTRAGLDPAHIETDGDCTACHPDKYWSHRLTGPDRGSMAALIELTAG